MLSIPTYSQTQATLSASRAKQNDEQLDIIPNPDKIFGNRIIIHYTHEKRFHTFKREMHHIQNELFEKTPVGHVKLIVGNRNRRKAELELIQKRLPT